MIKIYFKVFHKLLISNIDMHYAYIIHHSAFYYLLPTKYMNCLNSFNFELKSHPDFDRTCAPCKVVQMEIWDSKHANSLLL